MKIMVQGIRPYDFTDDDGRKVSGLSVFYTAQGEDDVRGHVAAKLSVKSGTPLYQKMIAANYDKPFQAEPVYDIRPGARKPVLVDLVG